MNQDTALPGVLAAMAEGTQLLAIQDDVRYETTMAAPLIHVKPTTLRNSRCTGRLAGVDAPAFIKMGSKVLYRGSTLKAWLAQFREQTSTRKAA
jgi:hypothetical protein